MIYLIIPIKVVGFMINQFSRTELLLGTNAVEILKNSRVAVFGIGGVGGHTAEALVRSGVGSIDIIDNDTVSLTNINRQLIATHSTIGKFKVDVARERFLDINPNLNIICHNVFYTPETESMFDFSKYDYIVDAIDTVTGKLALVVNANKAGTPIICSMGAGNKLDPTAFEVADIYKTSICPLARTMRKECKKRGIKHLKCVYSKEPAISPIMTDDALEELSQTEKRQIPGSNAFVPSVAGLIIAGEVIKDLTGVKNDY